VIALPWRSAGGLNRKLVPVAGTTAPRLRRLTILRRPGDQPTPPTDAPRAA